MLAIEKGAGVGVGKRAVTFGDLLEQVKRTLELERHAGRIGPQARAVFWVTVSIIEEGKAPKTLHLPGNVGASVMVEFG